nr:MAG TPA: hypothetical protein [Caudoviricetes sp.]
MQGAYKGVPCKNIFKISTFRLYKLVFLCKI